MVICQGCGERCESAAAHDKHYSLHYKGLPIQPMPVAFRRAFERDPTPEEIEQACNGVPWAPQDENESPARALLDEAQPIRITPGGVTRE
jgi:hypothetical protein